MPFGEDGAHPTRVHSGGHKMKALIIAIVGASFLLGACNTIEGAGKDVKAGGQKVESEAKENKHY
jgi:predicted small secreted protein